MKKWVALILVFTLLISFTVACTPKEVTSGDTKTGGETQAPVKTTLNVSTYSDPQNLNPYATNSRNAIRIYSQVYERLINRDANKPGEFVGILAESWKVADDGMSVTFNLRKGVKFHNGAEMKASDVVFSFKTMGNSPLVSSSADYILFDQVKSTDDYTVVLPLKYKSSLVLAALAASNMVIVNEKAWTELGDAVSAKAVGTNKMMIKDGDYQLNNQIIFTRFEEYWGTKAQLEKIVMRVIPESTQAAIELETGTLDLILDVASTDFDRINDSDTMKLTQFQSNTNDLLNFNNQDAIFKNVKVRQALAYAMKQEDIFTAVYRNWGRIAYNVITPDVWGYTGEFEGDKWPYKYDVEKAKAMLTEAGYPNGFSFDIYVDTDANRKKVSEILKNQFAQIGVTMNIKNLEGSALNDMLSKGTAQSWLYGVASQTLEPDNAMFIRFHKSVAKNGSSNYDRYMNDEYSKLLDDARLSFNTNEKAELYAKAQRIWVAEVPSIPYYTRMAVVASAKNLEGVVGYGEAYLLFDAYFK